MNGQGHSCPFSFGANLMAIRTHETDGSFADHMANHSAIAVLSEPGNGELGQYMVDWFTPGYTNWLGNWFYETRVEALAQCELVLIRQAIPNQ